VTFAHIMAATPLVQAIEQQVSGQVVLTATTANIEQMKRLEVAVHEAVAAAHLVVVAARVTRIDIADVLTGGAAGTAAPGPLIPVARLWIDAGNGSPATLYLTDGARRRVHVRRVPLESGLFDRVSLESIALIIGDSVNALIAGREIGVSRDAFVQSKVVAQPSPSASAAARTRATPRLSEVSPSYVRHGSVAAGYEIVRTAPLPYQHRVVVEYDSSWRRARAGMNAFVAAPQELRGVLVGARMLATGANVTAGAHWPTGAAFDLSVGAGLGIEAVRVEPNVNTAALRATPPFWSSAPSMRGFGLLERTITSLGDRWVLGLLVGVDVHPSPARYLIGGGPGSQVAFQAPRWRALAGVLVGSRM
jgi:hypothetical protein